MTLSSRERQIMQLICDGQRDKEIASALQISVRRTNKLVAAVMRKLRASNRAHAVFIFTQLG